MKTVLDIVVRSTELDINGHANNAKYLEYLEWGREDWYEQAGLDRGVFKVMGVHTVTVNININYRRECRQGDRLTVITQPEKIGRTSYVLKQNIVSDRGEPVADALVTSVMMNSATRQSVEVPAELRKLFA